MLSLRSIRRGADMQAAGIDALHARSFGTKVSQDDAAYNIHFKGSRRRRSVNPSLFILLG